jgi:hypothetical protein
MSDNFTRNYNNRGKETGVSIEIPKNGSRQDDEVVFEMAYN